MHITDEPVKTQPSGIAQSGYEYSSPNMCSLFKMEKIKIT